MAEGNICLWAGSSKIGGLEPRGWSIGVGAGNTLIIGVSADRQICRQVSENSKNDRGRYLQRGCLLHEENREPRSPWWVFGDEPLVVKVPCCLLVPQ